MRIQRSQWKQAVAGSRSGANFFRKRGVIPAQPGDPLPNFSRPDYAPLVVYDKGRAKKQQRAGERVKMARMPMAKVNKNNYNMTLPTDYRGDPYATPDPVLTPITTIDRPSKPYVAPKNTPNKKKDERAQRLFKEKTRTQDPKKDEGEDPLKKK